MKFVGYTILEYNQIFTYQYFNSPNPDAYPPDSSDGNTYIALGKLGDKVQIETGSYTGTGTYGSSNPNSLTASFPIKVAFIRANLAGVYSIMYLNGIENLGTTDRQVVCNVSGGSSVISYEMLSVSLNQTGKVLNYYSPSGNAASQLNSSNETYYYTFLG